MFFARACACCGRQGASPCGQCIDTFTPLGELAVNGVDRCFALVAYDDATRALIGKLKYRGVRASVPWIVAGMTQLIEWADLQPDVVTWIPAMGLNRRRRGFDQSELLARALAGALGVAPMGLLRRTGRRGQTGQSRVDRLEGPSLLPERPVSGAVAIVDDVLTTGASMRCAGQTLHNAGAGTTVGIVAAHRRC